MATLQPTFGPLDQIYYEIDEEGRRAELDGLLGIEKVVVVIEAKAGALSARGTRPALEDVVGAAVGQAERARVAPSRGNRLYHADGGELKLDLAGTETVISVG